MKQALYQLDYSLRTVCSKGACAASDDQSRPAEEADVDTPDTIVVVLIEMRFLLVVAGICHKR